MIIGRDTRDKLEDVFTFADYPVDNYGFILKISSLLQEPHILKLLVVRAFLLHQQQYNICIIPVYVSMLTEKDLRVILQTSLKILLL